MIARTLDLIMAALFAFAAILQLNDPDPVPWVAIYLAACILCLLAASGRRISPAWSAGVGVVAIAWAAVIAFGGPAVAEYGHIFDAWEMESAAVEEAREASGLVIVAAWMAVQAARRAAVRA